MLLPAILVAPFLGSLIAALMPENARNREAWLAACVSLFGLLGTGALYPEVSSGEVLRFTLPWLPAFGLDFVLRLDGLAWVFAMLVFGIGLLVVIYARYYMSPEDPVPRFFSFLLAFMGSMLGVVIAGNLVQLAVFWELTSITSFLLIGYWHHRADARRGARMAFTVTASGGLCLFAGVIIVGHIVGSYELDAVLAAGDSVRQHQLYRPALVLIVIGALSKSAQFPFHFWLPHAMAAPTPVSSYLHSATMVKAGVFLLMRLWPVLSGTPEWTWLVAGAGLITMLIGSFAAIFQHDIKGLLAYSTISHLGLITVLLGIGSPLAVVAAIFHTINHATFKASLFMAAGIIDHETGSRDTRLLRGLYAYMPITATLAIVASAAMAGVPLLNGFISKEMFFAEALHAGVSRKGWMAPMAIAMGVFSVTYSLRFINIFFGRPRIAPPKQPHEPPRWMRFPVELLVLACLVVGTLPALSVGPLLATAVSSVLGARTPSYDLAIWHGLNIPFLMSVAALLGGILFYLVLLRSFDPNLRERVPLIHRFSGAQAYENVMLMISQAANFLLRLFGTRRLQPQLLWLFLVFIAVFTAIGVPPLPRPGLGDLDPFMLIFLAIASVLALLAAWQAKYHRLTALVLAGGTGVVVAALFMWLSAPDLALTQLMVETVTTVLILLGLRWLPPRLAAAGALPPAGAALRRTRDLIVAGGGGLGIAGLTYAVLTMAPPADGIADFFVRNAIPGGGGGNVVNVLLVDFRAFDTLGEISVLVAVALTVYALLRRFRPAPESVQPPLQQQAASLDPCAGQTPLEQVGHGYLRVPGVYLRLIMPFMLLAAIWLFLRGHNQPGGGFVAGLLFAVAFVVQYMLAGTNLVETRQRLYPHRWLGFGLLTAATTGAGAWLFGHPFLSSHSATLDLPMFGVVHLPSAAFFDLGVFAVVVGASILILTALAHQSLRGHRAPVKDEASKALPALPTGGAG